MTKYLAAALLAALAALPAAAQDTAAPSATGTAATGNQPSETSERYGAWTLHCTTLPDTGKACEVLHVVRGQQGPIAQVAFGRPEAGEPVLAVIRTPLGMNLGAPVTLSGEGSDDVTLSWFICLQTGCLARTEVAAAQMEGITASTALQLAFEDGGERPVEIDLPVEGLSDALSRLPAE